MRRIRRERLEVPDQVLDPLRNRVAELSKKGRPEGFVSTRVETKWRGSTGRLWWKTWTQPREVLVLEISWVAKDGVYLYDDGVEDSASQIVQELLADTATLYGDVYEVRWLTDDERAAAERMMGVVVDGISESE